MRTRPGSSMSIYDAEVDGADSQMEPWTKFDTLCSTTATGTSMHTASLVVMGRDKKDEETIVESDGNRQTEEKQPSQVVGVNDVKEVPVAVVEQRVSNLVQGSICFQRLSPRLSCPFPSRRGRRCAWAPVVSGHSGQEYRGGRQ
jgi:hypothetical protein